MLPKRSISRRVARSMLCSGRVPVHLRMEAHWLEPPPRRPRASLRGPIKEIDIMRSRTAMVALALAVTAGAFTFAASAQTGSGPHGGPSGGSMGMMDPEADE